jgi:hypothetical protein
MISFTPTLTSQNHRVTNQLEPTGLLDVATEIHDSPSDGRDQCMRYVLLCVKVSRDDQQELSTSGGGGRTEDWAGEEMTSGTGRGETL